METLKDELTRKVRDKIIELFGPESALAQAMEDDTFFDKLADLVAYIYGLIALSQPRPEPRQEPSYPQKPWTEPLTYPRTKWEVPDWRSKYRRTTAGDFTYKVTSAMAKWADNWRVTG